MSKNPNAAAMLPGGAEPALEIVQMMHRETGYSLQTCAIIALVGAVKELAWEVEDLRKGDAT